MCIRYLESVKIKVKKEYRYISNNSYVFRFIFEERHIKDMTVLISFLRDDLIDSIRLQYSDKINIVYYKKYKNAMDTYGYFHQNDNKSKTRKLFMSAKKFVKYINHIYHKFYNTDYYNNLQSVTTFLLICKTQKIFPKDIYLIIAKKIASDASHPRCPRGVAHSDASRPRDALRACSDLFGFFSF